MGGTFCMILGIIGCLAVLIVLWDTARMTSNDYSDNVGKGFENGFVFIIAIELAVLCFIGHHQITHPRIYKDIWLNEEKNITDYQIDTVLTTINNQTDTTYNLYFNKYDNSRKAQ